MYRLVNWTNLHTKIHRTIRTRHLFEHSSRLLVAVSGGQDSLCLGKLLLDLQSKWGWDLAIAHCDHRWRSDSQANAEHVENIAKNWGIPFYLQTTTEVLNGEAAARHWRYQALTTIAGENNYHYIVTGHTQSDRAETLLYNLMRGSGADGLQSLTWQRSLANNILLVRPLLEVNRLETGQFCQDFHLPVWEDSTNQDLKYPRNRIRQELIPYLRENFNSQVESNLAQTAEILQAEVEYLQIAAEELRDKASAPLLKQTPASSCFRLNRRVLQTAPKALQRRVIRSLLQLVLPQAPGFDQIAKLTGLITAPNLSKTDPFPGGAIAQVQGDWIVLLTSSSPVHGR
ncbi:MAG: tRNA lysidine(34) synthetase TilS [Nostocaceae cyanobacterium]|nr:tRNA lysidine(34) synthetase TilS [Nostocaceae cyanobacterium]